MLHISIYEVLMIFYRFLKVFIFSRNSAWYAGPCKMSIFGLFSRKSQKLATKMQDFGNYNVVFLGIFCFHCWVIYMPFGYIKHILCSVISPNIYIFGDNLPILSHFSTNLGSPKSSFFFIQRAHFSLLRPLLGKNGIWF